MCEEILLGLAGGPLPAAFRSPCLFFSWKAMNIWDADVLGRRSSGWFSNYTNKVDFKRNLTMTRKNETYW